MTMIEMRNVQKFYTEGVDVLKNLNLTVNQGEFVTILGPSGCGKTTLLKLINKLIPFDSGDILVKRKSIIE